jgi:Fe-S-cluster containining protein
MREQGLIPWSEVHAWACTACGRCCVGYRVPLKMDEYVRVANRYGHGVVDLGLGKAYIRHGFDDRCVFQHPYGDRWLCALQGIKPLACKLFPFRVYPSPVYRRGDRSEYRFGGRTFHVYLDPDCEGVVPGIPGDRFLNQTLPEVVSIGMGLTYKQRFSTSKYIAWTPP